MRTRLEAWGIPWLVAYAAVALGVYAPSLRGPFVSDDLAYIQVNGLLALPFGAALHRAFLEPHFVMGNWAPVQMLFLWVEHQLFGDATLGWHVANVLLFAGSAFALRLVLRRGGASAMAATLGGALFLLHPAAVEVAAWVSQSKTLLGLLFALLALERWLAHLEAPRASRLFAAIALAALAILAKVAFVFLPVVFAAAWWTHGRGVRRDALPLVGLAAFVGIVTLQNLRAQALQGGVTHWFGGSPAGTARILPEVLWRYVRLAVLPLDVSTCVEPVPIDGWLDARVALPLVGLALSALLAIRLVLRDRRLALAVIWIGAMLLPVVQLVPMTTVFADRYLMVALPGFVALAAEPLVSWARRATLGRVAVGVLLALFALRSGYQAALWAAPERLYAQAVAAWPRSVQAWTGLGAEQHRRGDLDGAATSYLHAISLHPDDGHARTLLGAVRLAQNRKGQALFDLEESLRLASQLPDVEWTRANAKRLREEGVIPIPDGK